MPTNRGGCAEGQPKLRAGPAPDENTMSRQSTSARSESLGSGLPARGFKLFLYHLPGPSMPPSNFRAPLTSIFSIGSLAVQVATAVFGGRSLLTLPPKHFKTLINFDRPCGLGIRPRPHSSDFGRLPQRRTRCLDRYRRSTDCGGRLVQARFSDPYRQGRRSARGVQDHCWAAALRAISVHGGITGFAADLIIVDDPSDIGDAGSRKNSTKSIERFDRIIRTRLKNQATGRMVVIQQRLQSQ